MGKFKVLLISYRSSSFLIKKKGKSGIFTHDFAKNYSKT